jgi:glyoxylase-like metal-dependent hydrolase (beta-lactamase superfamily II)
MLEDDFTYVIRKALAGLELAPAQAAGRAGIDGAAVLNLLAGRWHEPSARALAPVLELDADALASHPIYEPPTVAHPAITRLDLPFGDEQVNAWLIDGGGEKLLVDSGCDETSLKRAIESICAIEEIRHVIITHNHRDHVGGLGLFEPQHTTIHGPGDGHPWCGLKPGDHIDCGGLRLDVHDLSGHAIPAIGLAISGLDLPVLATGDALFAGSIGGCPGRERHRLAKHNLFATLQPMDPQTLLLTGHGPATRLEAEWRRNPYLAAMRGA